jgi:hypothetical protein
LMGCLGQLTGSLTIRRGPAVENKHWWYFL